MLSADGVQQANSGHPGMPMGLADLAHVLFTRHLVFDPKEPRWLGRDRFVLSGGHGSMLLYSMLHLAGYDCTLEDLKKFRQLHSRTAGHPEFGHLPGIECTTGPLGQGIANAVGIALGQAMLSARLGAGNPVEDHFTYVTCGDGDLMEGVSAEAASFAGHNKLGRLVCLYDNNGITIDGKTSLTFTEDVRKRFEAYGWQVQSVDGRDHDGIDRAIATAKADLSRPSFISVKTVIGFGSPKKAGTASVHGSALGEEELAATKKALGWPESPRFLVPDDVRAYWAEVQREKAALKQAWVAKTEAWRTQQPEKARLLDSHVARAVPADLVQRLFADLPGPDATRKVSSAVIQKIAALVPSLVAGSADLFESNNNDIKGGGAVSADNYGGRNLYFGIREHAMAAIANGLAYDGLFIPEVATFAQFLDYMRPPVRLAALSKLQVVFVLTHDSIFLGEDGPTHQPHRAPHHPSRHPQRADLAAGQSGRGGGGLGRGNASQRRAFRPAPHPAEAPPGEARPAARQRGPAPRWLRGPLAGWRDLQRDRHRIRGGVGAGGDRIAGPEGEGRAAHLDPLPGAIHGPAAGGARRRVAARPPYGGGGGGARAGMVAAHRA